MRLINNRTIKVLVIDETFELANKIADLIRELLCVKKVMICTNYFEINDVILSENPDVILFEIHHSKVSGLAILKQFRLAYPTIKIIIVTNKVSSFYKDECREIGTDFFIDKSNDFDSIPFLLNSFCA